MEELNGLSAENKGGPPPPSPLTGCYLLIVVGEPHCDGHKGIILQKIAKGLLSWNVSDCLVDLEKELNIITEQALEGEENRFGERLIQFASENLVTEILIHPAVNTLQQCIRNLLSSFTKHRHIIHAGYTFQGNGSWALQDGTFSYADFAEAFHEIEVQRVIKAYENNITLDIHCSLEGEWPKLSKESFAKGCKVRLNPTDVLTTGSPSITDFVNYLSPFLTPTTLESILESSDVVGNIRFSRPTLYVFPGGQGDAALFGINGFNMLLDGGYSRKACFWDFVRHLDRLDAVLMTRLNNSSIGGISSVLRRKTQEAVYPQIGHFFCNIQDKKSMLSPDGDKDTDPLLINLIDEGQNIITDLRQLNLNPQSCYRDSDPIILYHKVGHGTLNMYVLSPEKNSKEVREFLQRWNASDSKLFSMPRSGKDFMFPMQNLVSICALLVWQPANPNDTITRILYPGSTPQKKIFEGLDRLKGLEYIKHPVSTEKSIVPIKKSVKKEEFLDKIIPKEKKIENKLLENGDKITENGDVIMKEKPVNGDKIQVAKSKKSMEEQTNNKILENGGDRVAKSKPKIDNKTAKPRSESQGRKKPGPGGEKKGPPTPKKTLDNKLNGESKEKPAVERKPIKRPSPSATPAKSTKDANNRKVVEEKRQPMKKEATSKPPAKEESKPKVERQPISRRPKTAKAPTSPMKKLSNGVQKPDSLGKRGKLDKEGTTDSSTVSTPSADQESVLKKDLSKLTPEEIQKLKEKEFKELQEEQEAIKEIEAVFRKGEGKPTSEGDHDARKIKDSSIDDKLDTEEYLIIEREEVEHTHEIQKLTKDSEETEKHRKLSAEETDIPPAQTEKEETQASDLEKAEINADDAAEINKNLEPLSDEKIEMTAAEKKELLDEELKDVIESHPEEKTSANIESGATTTAPTLPEDEKMTLDEIKEDTNQAMEEKHIKEDTKEKEDKNVPKIELPSKSLEPQPKLPPAVAGIKLDRSSHIRDIVKTPDEVADLPVHEEADFAEFSTDEKKMNDKIETDTKLSEKEDDTNVLEKAELETKEKPEKDMLEKVEEQQKEKPADKIDETTEKSSDLHKTEDLVHALKDEVVSEFIENDLKQSAVMEDAAKASQIKLEDQKKDVAKDNVIIAKAETDTKEKVVESKELELSEDLKQTLDKVEAVKPTVEEVNQVHSKVIEEKLTSIKDAKEEVERLDAKMQELKEEQKIVRETKLDKEKTDRKVEETKKVHDVQKHGQELSKLDDKLQKLKDDRESEADTNIQAVKKDEAISTSKTEEIQTVLSKSPETAEKVTLPDSSPEEDELKVLEELKSINKSELGRKSPQEREKDVEKIVAGVAEVLKSEVPIEVLAEKLPFAQSFTQELRETHITTQDSPIIESKIVENIPTIPEAPEEHEEKICHTESKPDSKRTSIAEPKESSSETSKTTADIPAEPQDDDDAGTVHRMLVTASSEDGGEEIEICPPGTIIFSRSSESSGRSSPDPSAKVSHKSSIVDTLSETISTVKQITAENEFQDDDIESHATGHDLSKISDLKIGGQEAKQVEEDKPTSLPAEKVKDSQQEKEHVIKAEDANKSFDKKLSEATPDAKGTESEKPKHEEHEEKLDIIKISGKSTPESKPEATNDTTSNKSSGRSTPEILNENIASHEAEKDKESMEQTGRSSGKSPPEHTGIFGSLKSAFDSAKEYVEEKLTDLSADTSKTLETIKDSKDSVVGDLKEKTDQAIKDSVDIVEQAKESLVEDFEKTKETVADGKEIIHEKVQETKEGIKDQVDETIEGLQKIEKDVEKIVEKTSQGAKEKIEQSSLLIDESKANVSQKIDEGVQKLEKIVAKDQEKIEEMEREMKDEVKVTSDVLKDAKHIISDKLDEVKDSASKETEKFEKEIDDVKKEGDEKKESFKEGVATQIGKIDANLNDLEKVAKENLAEIGNKIDDISKHEIEAPLDFTKAQIADLEVKKSDIDHLKDLVDYKELVTKDSPKKITPESIASLSPNLSGKSSPELGTKEAEPSPSHDKLVTASKESSKTPTQVELTDKVIKQADELLEKSEVVLSSILPEKDGQVIPDKPEISTDVKDLISDSVETPVRLKRELEDMEQKSAGKAGEKEIKAEEEITKEAIQLTQETFDETTKPRKDKNEEKLLDDYKVDKETVAREEKQIEDEVKHLEKTLDDVKKLEKSISFEKCRNQSGEFETAEKEIENIEKHMEEETKESKYTPDNIHDKSKETGEFKTDEATREKEDKQIDAKVLQVQRSLKSVEDLTKSVVFEKCDAKDFKVDTEDTNETVTGDYKVDAKIIQQEEKQIEKQVENLEKTLSEVEKLEKSVSFDKCSISSTASTARISDHDENFSFESKILDEVKEAQKEFIESLEHTDVGPDKAVQDEVLGSAEYDVVNHAESQKRKSITETSESNESQLASIDQKQTEKEIKKLEEQFIGSVTHDTVDTISVEKDKNKIEKQIRNLEEQFIESVTHDTEETVSVEKDKKKIEKQIRNLEEQFIESVTHDTEETVSVEKDKKKMEDQIKTLEEQFIESMAHDTEATVSVDKDKKKIEGEIKNLEEQFIESVTHDTEETISVDKDRTKLEDQIRKLEDHFIESVTHDTEESVSLEKDKKKIVDEINQMEKDFIESVTHDTDKSISVDKDHKMQENQIKSLQDSSLEKSIPIKGALEGLKDQDKLDKPEKCDLEKKVETIKEASMLQQKGDELKKEIDQLQESFLDSIPSDRSISPESDRETSFEKELKMVDNKFLEERSKVGDSSKFEEKYGTTADYFDIVKDDLKDLKLVDKKLPKTKEEKTDAPEKSDKDRDIEKDSTPKHTVDTITTEVKMDFVEAEYKSMTGASLDTEQIDSIKKESDIKNIVDNATPEANMDFVKAEYKAITGKPLVTEKCEGESMEKMKLDTLEIGDSSDAKKLSISDVEIKFEEQPSIKDATKSFLENETISDQIDSKVFRRPEEDSSGSKVDSDAKKESSEPVTSIPIDSKPVDISNKQAEVVGNESTQPAALQADTVDSKQPVEPIASSSTLQISSSATDMSGKSSPDVSGKSTAPVSPSLKDSQSTEPKMGSKVDSGLSEPTETDDDDLSTKSQVAQSDLEEMDQQLDKLDPMSMSFYGALPDETDSFSELPGTYLYEVTKAKYSVPSVEGGKDSTKQEVMSASFIGELPPPPKNDEKHDIMTSSFIGTLPGASKKDVVDQWGKPLGLPAPDYQFREHHSARNQQFDVMSSSFIGELPSVDGTDSSRPDLMNTSVYFDPSDDPIASWGKPLGLPSPAPPNNNSQGTPKKEKKLPSNVATKNKLNDEKKRAESPSKTKNKRINPVYVDLSYVPHHGNHFYSYVDFFKRVRARYYVFSGLEPSRQVYDALLEAKQTWDDKDLEVTIIPTYDTDILGYWVCENEDLLTKAKIDLSPSASRCTINLQDHETSCAAYRLEF